MAQDRIVEEVRVIRDGLAKEHGYDVKVIVHALQQDETKNRGKVVSLPSKRLPKNQVPKRAG